jgi:hypothetical protein
MLAKNTGSITSIIYHRRWGSSIPDATAAVDEPASTTRQETLHSSCECGISNVKRLGLILFRRTMSLAAATTTELESVLVDLGDGAASFPSPSSVHSRCTARCDRGLGVAGQIHHPITAVSLVSWDGDTALGAELPLSLFGGLALSRKGSMCQNRERRSIGKGAEHSSMGSSVNY